MLTVLLNCSKLALKTLERRKLAITIIIIIIIIIKTTTIIIIIIIITIIMIITKNATGFNNRDDLHHLSFILKIPIFLVVYK